MDVDVVVREEERGGARREVEERLAVMCGRVKE